MNSTTEAIHNLAKYIKAINNLNQFDLAWRWAGADTTPYVEVYEETDRHILIRATIDTAEEELQSALSSWGLADPKVGQGV